MSAVERTPGYKMGLVSATPKCGFKGDRGVLKGTLRKVGHRSIIVVAGYNIA